MIRYIRLRDGRIRLADAGVVTKPTGSAAGAFTLAFHGSPDPSRATSSRKNGVVRSVMIVSLRHSNCELFDQWVGRTVGALCGVRAGGLGRDSVGE